MKISHYSKSVAAILLAVAINISATDFEVILPTPPPKSIPPGLGRTLLIDRSSADSARDLFLGIGKSGVEQPEVASIYRVTPTDASSTTFTLEPVDYALDQVYKLDQDLSGFIYAVGDTSGRTAPKSKTFVTTWKVRRSADGGNTWDEIDSYRIAGKTLYNSFATGVASDSIGNIYVCGIAADAKANHWTVRRRLPSGTWSVVYDAAVSDTINKPYTMCFFPGKPAAPSLLPAIFAVGILNDRWTVLRSRDSGAHWQNCDPWTDNPATASAWDAICDSEGNIYVAGVRGYDGNNRGWVLRRSIDGGDSWAKLLDVAEGTYSWASRVAVDGMGRVTVSGATHDPTGKVRWVVVRNSPGTPWSESWAARMYPLGQSTVSKGRGIAVDAGGNVFLTGDIIDWTDEGNTYAGTHVGLLRMIP